MASSEISINALPITSQIVNGDFLISQSSNTTSRLNFENFVIGLDNTTFKDTIETHGVDIVALSGVLYATPAANSSTGIVAGDISGLPITIGGTNYQILLSATYS